MAKIIPFKTRQQLEAEKALRVKEDWKAHLEWEKANWHHVIKQEEKEVNDLSNEEIEWLNNWVKQNDD